MSKPSHAMNVFVSHSRSDAAQLEGIRKSLTTAGLIGPEDHVIGEKEPPAPANVLREEVKRQIESATKVVVVWDAESANSQWVNYELGLADALGKQIVVAVRSAGNIPLPASLQDIEVVEMAGDH
jgi:hypothetical protein